ncbi:MAG: IMS domain-containing protein [Pseudanabaenaceae cyanobacterium bins.39]|nr:IMS domain-containing protein [Pseudanabaenaceae cyanobacterium bins.39]
MTMIGQLLDGRYLVTQKLSEGGFGHTYLAQDTRIPHESFCVVKHLKPANTDREYLQVASRLFTSEAKILAQLGSHDRLPRLLAYFQEGGEFFLVEDFVKGRSLEEEVSRGQRLAEQQVIQILDELLGVLEYIHGHGVIHRDIKPDNVIRRQSEGKLVLIDFGAIKQVQTQLHQEHQTALTVAIGTLGYMPSEQAQGKPRPNSDLYALGMIGIQALTGMLPKDLQTDYQTGELIWQHLVAVRSPLVDILTKMTRYHYKDRYSTATEARQALSLLSMPSSQMANPPQGIQSTIVSVGKLNQDPTIVAQVPPTILPSAHGLPNLPNSFNGALTPPQSTPQYGKAVKGDVTLQVSPVEAPVAYQAPNSRKWVLVWLGALVSAIAIGAVMATKHNNPQLVQTKTPNNLDGRSEQISVSPTPAKEDVKPSAAPKSSPTASLLPTPTLTPQPSPTQPVTVEPLSESEAVALVNELVANKGAIFAPPFDLELLGQLTTGEAYDKRKGAIAWLKEQNAYYKFDVFTVKSIGTFGIQNNQANLTVEISENPTLFVNGKVDPRESVPTQGTYVCTFLFVDGKWKIANLTKL